MDEEDVDHIGVVGEEEEEETRVSIFSFFAFYFYRVSYLLLALRFSSAGRRMPGKYRTNILTSAKIFCY